MSLSIGNYLFWEKRVIDIRILTISVLFSYFAFWNILHFANYPHFFSFEQIMRHLLLLKVRYYGRGEVERCG